MKKYISLILGVLILFSLGSCYSSQLQQHRKAMPPGQAKKYHGEQSAKRFAPGQVKKSGKKQKHKH